jgi:hypothetical protein
MAVSHEHRQLEKRRQRELDEARRTRAKLQAKASRLLLENAALEEELAELRRELVRRLLRSVAD